MYGQVRYHSKSVLMKHQGRAICKGINANGPVTYFRRKGDCRAITRLGSVAPCVSRSFVRQRETIYVGIGIDRSIDRPLTGRDEAVGRIKRNVLATRHVMCHSSLPSSGRGASFYAKLIALIMSANTLF